MSRAGLVAGWHAISLPKKITACLVPAVFLLLLLPPPEPERPEPTARTVTPAQQGSTAPGPSIAAKPTPAPPEQPMVQAPGAPENMRPSSPGNSAAPSITAGAAGSTNTAGAAAAAPASPAGQREPSNAARGDATAAPAAVTDPLERIAIDAAFEGRWQDAMKAYEQLASTHPEQPSFREAARIIRENKLGQR